MNDQATDRAGSRTDRMGLAASLFKGILLFCSAVLLLLLLDDLFRNAVSRTRTAALFRHLGLSVPALAPSGREARNPQLMDGRVNMKFSPFLNLPDPDVSKMIIRGNAPVPSGRRRDRSSGLLREHARPESSMRIETPCKKSGRHPT